MKGPLLLFDHWYVYVAYLFHVVCLKEVLPKSFILYTSYFSVSLPKKSITGDLMVPHYSVLHLNFLLFSFMLTNEGCPKAFISMDLFLSTTTDHLGRKYRNTFSTLELGALSGKIPHY